MPMCLVDSNNSLNHEGCITCLNWRMYNHLGSIHNSSNTLYILRHGHSEANEQRLIVSDIKNGITNYGLSAKGIQEIKDSIYRLITATHTESEYIIYSSPFLRTVQTSLLVAEIVLAKEIYYDSRLRERFFGEWELTENINYQKVWLEDFQNPYHKKWCVESTYEVLERVTSAVREIDSLYKDKQIIFVTHGDVAQILISGYLNQNPQSHRQLSSIETGELKVLHQPIGKIKSDC